MALFQRKQPSSADPVEQSPDIEVDEDGLPLTPARPLGDDEHRIIAVALDTLAVDGVNVEDLTSLDEGLAAAYRGWASDRSQDNAQIVQRYAVGIGEHLCRTTDLSWALVTDVFGTDLGLVEGARASFMIVPGNLVAVRWMRGETGWITDVVGHLVRRRNR